VFFDSLESINPLAHKSGFSIFIFPKSFNLSSLKVKAEVPVHPDDKGVISVETVRDIAELAKNKQASDFRIVFYSADALTESAANALLKILEQPGDNTRFVFLTAALGRLLPAIKSRANLYFYRQVDDLGALSSDKLLVPLAKSLIASDRRSLLSLAESLGKDRHKALAVTAAAIEITRKSYFKTKSPALLKKLAKLLNLYDNLSSNGHIKLHIIADMI
jgi:DNA polymerase III delta prime subunit